MNLIIKKPLLSSFSSSELKLLSARNSLERLHQKFPRSIDRSICKELDRIAACLDVDFIDHRSADHLTKLAYSIYFTRKKISREKALSLPKDHCYSRIIPSFLHFSFGSKPVLGVLTHAYLKDRYASFNEENVLLIIRRCISEAQLVEGSTYIFRDSKNGIQTLYFEIDKKSGLPFTPEESAYLDRLLKQELKFCIEQLVPHIFMIRNEEEVLRNILTLSREIHHIADLPQVIILFDQQTLQDVVFTIILVRAVRAEQPSIAELFSNAQEDFIYVQERRQTVKYFRKTHPIEANVFKLTIPKKSYLLRANLSLNFYLARQKISNILENAVGEFRDFNGGIILKQRERFFAFAEEYAHVSFQNPDLLENFFYALSPIEIQATLPMSSLKSLFSLFLEALDFTMTKPSDYFFKTHQEDKKLFLMIRASEKSIKTVIDEVFATCRLAQNEIVSIQSSQTLGYLIDHPHDQLVQTLDNSLKEWQQRMDSRQILKLGLESSVVSLDPRIGGDQISSIILKMLFEGLMRESKEGKIENGLAYQVEISPNLKTYIFKLRPAQWSDGSFVSAFDFEYAWKKILSPSFSTPFAYLFYPIKNAKLAKNGQLSPDAIGVRALDDLTLQVELESPTPYFLELTAHTIYSPVNRLVDQLHPNWPFGEKGAFVCNGAFQLSKNRKAEGYTLIKNPLYWDTQHIQLDQVTIVKASRHQAYDMFLNHNNHWIGAPLVTRDFNFASHQHAEAVRFFNNGLYWYVLNNQKFPFSNKKLRQALALSIDRSRLQELLGFIPALSPVPPLHSQLKESVLSHFDLKKSQFLFEASLKEMNLAHDQFPMISLIHLQGPLWSRLSEFIKNQWEIAFGIQCTLEPLEWSSCFSKIVEGDFQIGALGWEPWVNDAIYTLNAFRDEKDPINIAHWENEEYKKILYSAEKEVNLEKRLYYYLKAEELLLEEMPVIPLVANTSQALKKKNFRINSSSTLINFKWGYFEPLA